ncbi:MAG: hypothetical protein IKC05_08870, partial [Lentisphaeria bacterium]|nr:hypothetical protein [Lentisphaeria bacterium]
MSADDREKTVSGSGDFAPSLTTYLQQIGQLPLLSPEEQTALGDAIEDVTGKLRCRMRRFGFVAREYTRILDECSIGKTKLTDCFLPSSLGYVSGESAGEDCKISSDELLQWRQEIYAAYSVLSEHFSSGKDCTQAREKMAQVMSRYSINACLLEEQADVVRDYVSLLKDNKQTEELLSGRFFMTSEEFCSEAEKIASLREDLNKLRNRMVETNLRLVVSLAQKFRNRGVLFNDLIQE